jgi:hypothetical protein
VTHLFDLAQRFYLEQAEPEQAEPEQAELEQAELGQAETALFLRAERQADGARTFRLAEGEPLPTSHGEDVYRRIFGADLDTAPAR